MWINRKAQHDYNIETRKEVGIVLLGSEVKSIRTNGITLLGAYASFNIDAFWIYKLKITQYATANAFSRAETERPRKLLLKKQEIKRLIGATQRPGYSLIPLKAYFNDKGIFKIELGLCKGKSKYDKRNAEREKEEKRDMQEI